MPNETNPILDRLAYESNAIDRGSTEATWGDTATDFLVRAPVNAAVQMMQGAGQLADRGMESLGFDGFDNADLRDDNLAGDWFAPKSWSGQTIAPVVGGIGVGLVAGMGIASGLGKVASLTRAAGWAEGVIANGGVAGTALKAVTNRYVASQMIGGALQDFVTQRDDDGHLSDLLVHQVGGMADNAITRFLSSGEDDSWLASRSKAAIEGGIIGLAFDGVLSAAGYGVGAAKAKVFGDSTLYQKNVDSVKQVMADPKAAAERGLISPELAEKLGKADWASDQFVTDGPARMKLREDLTTAGGDAESVDAALAVFDPTARMYAVKNGVTVDEAYKTMFAGAERANDGAVTAGSLLQVRAIADVFNGSESLGIVPTGIGGKPIKSDLGRAINERQAAFHKYDVKDHSPKVVNDLADAVVGDVEVALKDPALKDAIGWYKENLGAAYKMILDSRPELNTQEGKFILRVAMAATSPEARPDTNLMWALQVADHWVKNGTIYDSPLTDTTHKKILGNVQHLIDKHGIAGAEEILAKEMTVKEISGYGKKLDKEKVGETLRGSALMGSKVGAFYSNLSGHYDQLTMDRWFSMTMNRYRGTMLKEPEAHRASLERASDKLVKAARKASRSAAFRERGIDMSRFGKDAVYTMEVAKDIVRPFEKRGYKNGTALEKAANRIVNVGEATIYAPRNGGEKAFYRRVMAEAQKRAAAKGITADIADFQALLWYFEKEFQNRVGVGNGNNELIDFRHAAEQLLGVSGPPRAGADSSGRQPLTRSGSPEESGTDVARGARGRYYHFSGTDLRAAGGIKRSFAGTARAGAERASFRKLSDGSLDPDSASVHLYLDNSKPEAKVVSGSGKLHKIEADYKLLDNGDPEFTKLRQSVDGIADQVERQLAFRKAVLAAGYDGIKDTRDKWGAAQLFKDVPPEHITDVADVTPEMSQGLGPRGQDVLYQKKGKDVPGQMGLFGDSTESPRGAVSFLEDGRAVIKLFKGADKSTIVHEMSHVFRRHLGAIDKNLLDAAGSALGVKNINAWTRAEEEAFAQGWENYLHTGAAPVPELKNVFDKFKDWFSAIYRRIAHQVNPQLRDVFDAMLGKGWNRSDPAAIRPTSRPANTEVKFVRDLKSDFHKTSGVPEGSPPSYPQVDVDRAKRIADEYDAMKHDPSNPEVQAAYGALKSETLEQYKHITDKGIKPIAWDTAGEPYASSQAMQEDLEGNKRLYFFRTITGNEEASFGQTKGTGDNPLLELTGIKVKTSTGADYEMTYNDLFRFVHDIYGHAGDGHQFGPRGEEGAWLAHSKMYSPQARRALTTETRGQNSWVNYGKHLRKEDGSLPAKGEAGWVSPKERKFADQKVGLLPEWAAEHPDLIPPTETQKVIAGIQETYAKAKAAGMSDGDAVTEAVGTHINYSRLKTSEDATAILQTIEPITQKLIDDDIGKVLSLEDINDMAEVLSKKPDEVVGWFKDNKAGLSTLPAKMVALRKLRSAVTEQHATAAQRLVESFDMGHPISPDMEKAFTESREALLHTDELVGIVQKSIARTVTSGNITVESGTVDVDQVLRLLNGDRSPEVMAAAAAADSARKAGNAELAAALDQVAEEAKTPPQKGKKPKAKKGATKPQEAPAAEPAQTAPTSPDDPTAQPTPAGVAPAGSAGMAGAVSTNPTTSGAGQSPNPTSPTAPAPNSPAAGQAAQGQPPAPTTQAQKARMIRAARMTVVAAQNNQGPRQAKLLKKAAESGLLDVFLEHYKASILSGIPTFAVNGISGSFNTILQPIARGVGSAASGDWKELKNSFRLVVNVVGAMGDMTKSMFMQTPGNDFKGMRAVARTFMQEKPTLTNATAVPSKQATSAKTFGLSDQGITGKSVNMYGKNLVRIPFRVNQSIEEFFSQVNYLAFIRTKAADAADSAVWGNNAIPGSQKAAAAMAFIDQYTKNSFDNIGGASTDPTGTALLHKDAARYAQSVNYSQDLVYGIGNSLMELKRKHPIIDLIMPFVKAPTNIIRQAINMTPVVGQLNYAMTKRLASRSRDEVLRARGEMLIGAAYWTMAGWLASQGKITGNGPVNRQERDVLMATGWRPYSLAVQGEDGKTEYIEYRRFDPVSSILGLAADFTDASAHMGEGERDGFAARALLSLANNFSSKTYLTGLSEFFRVASQPQTYAKPYIQNRLSAVVPNFVAKYNASDDEAIHETRTMLDAIRRRLPGMSDDLPPRRNILGEPVTPTPGFLPFGDTQGKGLANQLGRMMSPIGYSKQVDDKVFEEMSKLAYAFGPPSKTLNGIDLTTIKRNGREAYDRLYELSGKVEVGGKNLAQALNRVVSSDTYKRIPAPTDPNDAANPRVRLLRSVVSGYRAAATRQLMREFPEIEKARREIITASATGQSRNDILARLTQ